MGIWCGTNDYFFCDYLVRALAYLVLCRHLLPCTRCSSCTDGLLTPNNYNEHNYQTKRISLVKLKFRVTAHVLIFKAEVAQLLSCTVRLCTTSEQLLVLLCEYKANLLRKM